MSDRRDCSLCGLEFSNETELRRHSNLVHGDYINTLINNLQSDLSKKPIDDETFQLLENNLDSNKLGNIQNLRRSKRIKKEINYLEKAEKFLKSEKIKGEKKEVRYEVITLDSDSEEIPEEELSPKVQIAPMTVVSSQNFRSKLSRRLSDTKRNNFKIRRSSHNRPLPNWYANDGPTCDQCVQVFQTKTDLERHFEDKHSFKCTRCVATIIFQTKSAYKLHNERNHLD